MIKYVIFDFDGTLVQSRSLVVQLYNMVAEKYGYRKIKKEDIEFLSTLSIKERIKVLKVPLIKLPKLALEMKEIYRKCIDSLQIVENIPELFDELKNRGIKVGIISSNKQDIIHQFLESNPIHVDSIYCTRSLFGKSAVINHFLKKHHLRNEEVIYVGDEYRDILACKKSNIKIIAVTWGYESIELLSKGNPTYIAHHPLEVIGLLHE